MSSILTPGIDRWYLTKTNSLVHVIESDYPGHFMDVVYPDDTRFNCTVTETKCISADDLPAFEKTIARIIPSLGDKIETTGGNEKIAGVVVSNPWFESDGRIKVYVSAWFGKLTGNKIVDYDIRDIQTTQPRATRLTEFINSVKTPCADDDGDLCPICNTPLEFNGDQEIEDDSTCVTWVCPDCGATGTQWNDIVFSEHRDIKLGSGFAYHCNCCGEDFTTATAIHDADNLDVIRCPNCDAARFDPDDDSIIERTSL